MSNDIKRFVIEYANYEIINDKHKTEEQKQKAKKYIEAYKHGLVTTSEVMFYLCNLANLQRYN